MAARFGVWGVVACLLVVRAEAAELSAVRGPEVLWTARGGFTPVGELVEVLEGVPLGQRLRVQGTIEAGGRALRVEGVEVTGGGLPSGVWLRAVRGGEAEVEWEGVRRVVARASLEVVTQSVERAPLEVGGGAGWVESVLASGPPSERLDLVLVSEGYTAGDAESFRAHCAEFLGGLAGAEPYRTYLGCWNVHAVFVPASRRGILPAGAEGRGGTVFGTRFTRGTLVTASYRRVWEVAESAPGADLVVVLCNEDEDVGMRQGRVCFVSRVYPEDTALHELGHSVGNLADEYVRTSRWESSSEACSVLGEDARPNVTCDPDRVPWRHWLAAPVPEGLGVYEGGFYAREGVYRPREEGCRMRFYRNPEFCEPCREALVLGMYDYAELGEGRSRFDRAGGLEVEVRTVIPAGTRRVEWTHEGGGEELTRLLAEASARGDLAVRVPAGWVPGVLRVRVEDTTAWVRRDRERLVFVWEVEGRALEGEGMRGALRRAGR